MYSSCVIFIFSSLISFAAFLFTETPHGWVKSHGDSHIFLDKQIINYFFAGSNIFGSDQISAGEVVMFCIFQGMFDFFCFLIICAIVLF